MGAATRVRRAGLVSGPLLALACYWLLPTQYATGPETAMAFTAAGRATLAMVVWMATWWMTEAVDIEVTALLPIAIFPLLGIASIAKATLPYASDVIYLFMGGFILGLAIERWGLDRRIVFFTLRLTGTRPGAMVAGFMVATAFLSMWISNTACAAMMVPIAVSVIDLVLRSRTGMSLRESGGIPQERVAERNFAICLLLAVAYSASIGGIATLIGTPPNGIAARFIAQTYGTEISFLDWMAFGLPFTVVFLPLAWLILTKVLFPVSFGEVAGGARDDRRRIREARASRPRRRRDARRIRRGRLPLDIRCAPARRCGGGLQAPRGPHRQRRGDAGRTRLVPASRRPGEGRAGDGLGHGGEVALGRAHPLRGRVEPRGGCRGEWRPAYIGHATRGLAVLPPLVLLLAVVTMTVFLSEVTSNTAQVATMTPVLAAMAPALGLDPKALVIVCAVAASSAYMMPVGTPPNAIVFGTGLIRMPQMVRAGFVLNIAGILVITALGWWLIPQIVAGRT